MSALAWLFYISGAVGMALCGARSERRNLWIPIVAYLCGAVVAMAVMEKP